MTGQSRQDGHWQDDWTTAERDRHPLLQEAENHLTYRQEDTEVAVRNENASCRRPSTAVNG